MGRILNVNIENFDYWDCGKKYCLKYLIVWPNFVAPLVKNQPLSCQSCIVVGGDICGRAAATSHYIIMVVGVFVWQLVCLWPS